MHATAEIMLSVDMHDLHAFSSELYSKVVTYPSEVITLMDSAVKMVYADIASVPAETVEVQVMPVCLRAPNSRTALHTTSAAIARVMLV